MRIAAALVVSLVMGVGAGWSSDDRVAPRSPKPLPIEVSARPAPDLAAAAPEASLWRNWNEREIDCLARNIYWEAGFQSAAGKSLVAHVTMNRVDDRRFPGTICGVVLQRRQFSWTIRSSAHTSFRGPDARPPKNKQWHESLGIARLVAERTYWWAVLEELAMQAGNKKTIIKTSRPIMPSDLLDAARQLHAGDWLEAHGYPARQVREKPNLEEQVLSRKQVAGLLWYLNPRLTPKSTIRRWQKRMVPVKRVGGHLFFADRVAQRNRDS